MPIERERTPNPKSPKLGPTEKGLEAHYITKAGIGWKKPNRKIVLRL
jgi:hypothetical protein